MEYTKINGYVLVAEFSRKHHKLGGVAIYAEEAVGKTITAPDISEDCIELTCEAALIEVNLKGHSFHLLGIYRPPGGPARQAIKQISNILTKAQADARPLILIGDLNFDRLTVNTDNALFEEELTTYGIRRFPLPATRITDTSETSIDCICTNIPDNAIDSTIIQTGLSDHTGQLCTLEFTKNNNRTQISMSRRIYNRTNMDHLKSELDKEDWYSVQNAQDVEEAYSAFHTTVKMALNCACPEKQMKTKPKPNIKALYDDEVRTLKNEYLQSLNTYEITGSLQDKVSMVAKKRAYDLKLRTIKRNTISEHILKSENKSKAVWNVINSEKQNKQINDSPLNLQINNELEDDPLHIAEHLNHFFSQIAESTLEENRKQQQNTIINHEHTIVPDHPPMTLTPTNHKEVITVIDSLKTKLSCGVDEIPSKVVKHCAKQLAVPLVSIINKSFSLGHFPSALKVSKIYPKHKKGDATKAENYRPISLISTFSKIIEKIALIRILHHLKQHDLLTKNQHGFIKGKSTVTAINCLVEYVMEELEDHRYVSAILLDYSKAFDCLGHDLILKKISSLGIKGTAKNWVASYLEGRKQMVEVKKTINGRTHFFRSKPLPVKRGVPQGSIMGPFLFVLFTNDFPRLVKNESVEPIMYADDTTLLLSNDSPQELHANILQSTEKALEYCLQNDLAINPSKTVQINFSRRHGHCPEVPNISIQPHTKLLGITIDAELSWTEHVDSIARKLSAGIYAVRRMSWVGGPEIAKTAYYALVESHIRYGLTAWGGTSDTNLNRILILQKKAVRALANLDQMDSCREAYKSLGILTVIALYIQSVILYTDETDLPKGGDVHSYNTRRATDYHLPMHYTTQYSRKPTYMGRKLHNSLPPALKGLRGKQLKTQLKQWLVERPVYSIGEYMDLANFNNM